MSALYEQDFHAWCLSQEISLRSRNFDWIDFDNLAEEIASMGGSQRSELTNRLEILICHLLKWKHQPGLRSNSWKYTIEEQMRRIDRLLRKNPSLKHYYEECLQDGTEDGIKRAAAETGLEEHIFERSVNLGELKFIFENER